MIQLAHTHAHYKMEVDVDSYVRAFCKKNVDKCERMISDDYWGKSTFQLQKSRKKILGNFFALRFFINYYELYYLLKGILSLLQQDHQGHANEGI